MINWELKKFKINDLKDYPKNPRNLSKEQYENLSQSIIKFGLIDKPICTQNGMLIGGHQRKNILKSMNVDEIECYVPDRNLNEKEIEELNIRLNKNIGDWDWDVLANEFQLIDLINWGFEENDFKFLVDEEVKEKKSNKKKPLKCPKCGCEI